jgi:hypothetical protein
VAPSCRGFVENIFLPSAAQEDAHQAVISANGASTGADHRRGLAGVLGRHNAVIRVLITRKCRRHLWPKWQETMAGIAPIEAISRVCNYSRSRTSWQASYQHAAAQPRRRRSLGLVQQGERTGLTPEPETRIAELEAENAALGEQVTP